MTFDPRYRWTMWWRRYMRPDVPVAGTQPVAPTNLDHSAVTDTSVTLTWTASVSPGITAHRLYLDKTRYTAEDPIAGGATSVVVDGLEPNTTYTWRITAYNGSIPSNSPFSVEHTVTTTSTTVHYNGPADLTGEGTITADGAIGFTGTAARTGSGAVALSGNIGGGVLTTTATRPGTGLIVPTGRVGRFRTAARTGTGIVVASGNVSGGGAQPHFLGHKPGRIYLGISTSHTDSGSDNQLNNQTPLLGGDPVYSDLIGLRRLYNKNQSVIDYTDARNRVLWISEKAAGLGGSSWANIASGASPNSGIDNYFSSLVARNKLTVFTFHHEPVGDNPNDGATYCNAFRRIMQRVDTVWPGHRIIFCPNYEENRLLRNLNGGGFSWATWVPENMMPGGGGARPWDLISFDCYQFNADINDTPLGTHNVYFSNRWPTIEAFFEGDYVPNGTTPASVAHLRYTIGTDLTLSIGEGSSRPGAYYYWQTGTGTASQRSNLTGAKYARDYLNYVFNNPTHFAFVSWFNSIGADILYNDERLYPSAITWGGDTQTVNLTQQTGDTEYTINVYRQKLRSGIPVKITASGLPA